MTERITDERLAELRAIQDKRIKGRGGVPEVRDLAKALTELAESRERETASTVQYGCRDELDGLVWVPCETAKEAMKYATPGDVLCSRVVGPWVEVTDDDE